VSWVPAEQVLHTVAAQRQVIAEQEKRIADFNAYHAAERAKLAAEQRAASEDLGRALLPRFDAASIAYAAQAVGMVGLPAENLPAKLEARRAWLLARLQQILGTPEYAQRELLRHPRTGSLTRALAEAQEYRGLANQFVALCEESPRFESLMENGWGTPAEKTAWWRYSFWQDRAAAAELLAKCPGKTTFAEVRAEYEKGKENVATYDADIARLQGQIAGGVALEREYGALWDEHHNLDARALEHTRGRIVQHLLGVDASAITQRLRAESSPFLMLFLRASGLAAKGAYLDGIQRNSVNELQRELAQQREKLNGVETRTRKRWAPMPLDKFQKLAEDRRPRYDKRWQRTEKVYQTVYVYDRWDRGRYYDDLLWWDLMTRGRYDGSYIPEVSTWHQSHPDYQFDPDWKTRAASYDYADYAGDGGTTGDGTAHEIGGADDGTAAASAVEADYAGDVSGDADPTGDGDAGDLASTDAS
jgi:hypothetical protein